MKIEKSWHDNKFPKAVGGKAGKIHNKKAIKEKFLKGIKSIKNTFSITKKLKKVFKSPIKKTSASSIANHIQKIGEIRTARLSSQISSTTTTTQNQDDQENPDIFYDASEWLDRQGVDPAQTKDPITDHKSVLNAFFQDAFTDIPSTNADAIRGAQRLASLFQNISTSFQRVKVTHPNSEEILITMEDPKMPEMQFEIQGDAIVMNSNAIKPLFSLIPTPNTPFYLTLHPNQHMIATSDSAKFKFTYLFDFLMNLTHIQFVNDPKAKNPLKLQTIIDIEKSSWNLPYNQAAQTAENKAKNLNLLSTLELLGKM